MKQWFKLIFLIIISFCVVFFISGTLSADSEPNEKYDEVKLKPGEVFRICNSGMVVCPVTAPICDNTKILELVDTPDGLGFKALSKGSTLCSVKSTVGQRFIFRLIID